MPTMDCPYADCPQPATAANADGCQRCGRRTRLCLKCGQLSRALSRFCRNCGERLVQAPDQWVGFQGGPDRRGVHGFAIPLPNGFASLGEPVELARVGLRAPCRSLLFYEGYLLAVADDGTLTALDLVSRKVIGPSRVAQSTTAVACITHGLLLVAGGDQLTATPLASLARSRAPEAKSAATLPGSAADALLALDGRLYATVATSGGWREIVSLEVAAFGRIRLGEVRSVHRGRAVTSPVASSAAPGMAYFLSEDSGEIFLHRSEAGRPAARRLLAEAQPPLGWQTPISSIGHHLFAVLGEHRGLCRINLEKARREEWLAIDVRAFAVAGPRDAVAVQGTGLYSVARNQDEPIDDSMRGSPLLWRELAVVIGLSDGRIQLRDVKNLARHLTARVSEIPEAGVTALAAHEDYLAAASEDGNLKLFRLVRDPGPSE